MKRSIFAPLCIVTALALTLLAMATRALAYPEPEIVSVSWQLDYEFKAPRVIAVQLPGEARPKLFWYMLYTVTNKTADDQLFIPTIHLYTDQGDLAQAGKGVAPAVFDAIKKETRDPLLVNPIQVSGKLLQGEDNAKSSVAVWPVPDHDVDNLRIFVGGLSGETKEWQDPYSDRKVFLQKTLMIDYAYPGDQAHVSDKKAELKDKTWIMR